MRRPCRRRGAGFPSGFDGECGMAGAARRTARAEPRTVPRRRGDLAPKDHGGMAAPIARPTLAVNPAVG